MQEKLLIYWQQIEAHLRPIMFALMIAMLGFIFYLKTAEQPSPPPDGGGQPKAELQGNRDAAQKIRETLLKPKAPLERTEYAALVADNMFSVKTIQESAEKEQAARRLYNEARELSVAGEYAKALEKVNEALAFRPSLLDAISLKSQLEKRIGEGAAPPPAPEP
jgi:hypothetical protein